MQVKRVRLIQFIFFLKLYLLIGVIGDMLVTTSYGEGIASDELIEKAKDYDGKEIVFQGEVIGDIMERRDGFWINISDGKNAIGVFCKKEFFCGIRFTGDYSHKGDILEIRGIFHRACPEHGGDLDIHAIKMTRLKEGERIIHLASQKKIQLVIWLGIGLFILVVIGLIRGNFL